MLVSLGLEGLFLIIIMWAALGEMSSEMGGGRFLYFLQQRKTFGEFKQRSELSNNDGCMGEAA